MSPRLITVHFLEVGREKHSWAAEVPYEDLGYTWMVQQIRRHHALMSHDLDFEMIEEDGVILAGIRIVGRFRLEWDSLSIQPEEP